MFLTNFDAEERTWYGKPTAPVYHPNVSVAQVMLDAQSRRPHHIGLVCDSTGVRLTNRALRLNTIRVAEHLGLLGVGIGDVLSVVAKNHHHVSAVVLAGMALAAPVNTLDPNFGTGELLVARIVWNLNVVCESICDIIYIVVYISISS